MSISSRNRRFARLEQSGLSGVILYEIPVKHRSDGRTCPGVTLEEVFGSKEGNYEDGMNMKELLGSTDARLVYFPAYACTSFFIGQVMHTFLAGDCHLQLRPALNGFFVFTDSSDQDGYQSAESIVDESAVAAQICGVEDSEGSAASNSDEDERLSEKFDSSVDSLGPPTPPRLDSPPIHDFNTVLLDILAPEK